VLHVPRVAALPPEAAAERAEFEAEHIQSVIMVPLLLEGAVTGYMGFDAVRKPVEWAPEIVVLLTIAGEIVFNALHRKRAELALREQAEALERANNALGRSNEELKQFAYVASHDLQEPLRAIAGFSSLLTREYKDKLGPPADEYLQYITASAGRLHAMIVDLLDYSRVDSKAMPFVDTDSGDALTMATANLVASIEESGAQVQRGSMPTVLADRSQLVQVFQNLIANAIKFRGEAQPRVNIETQQVNGEWRFSVADNGIGFESRYNDQIFQIFRRLHGSDRFPGTGIGLSVCKRIVERHGGRIWVESAPGKGTTFYFTLPAHQAAVAAVAAQG
jgi:light-regulated signal transduction histidine kinase (bacteriophytochrome)